MNIPNHLAFILGGCNEWSKLNNCTLNETYEKGLFALESSFDICKFIGVKEITYYISNMYSYKLINNNFFDLCNKAVQYIESNNAASFIIGNTESALFPEKLIPYAQNKNYKSGRLKVNFLINYGYEWDLKLYDSKEKGDLSINSFYVSAINLIVKWGKNNINGFLPIQSLYSKIYCTGDNWPNFEPLHIFKALNFNGVYEKHM